MIERILADAGLSIKQLDAILCCVGPGSFVGVRIAIGVAKGLAYGADIPLGGISALAALACKAKNIGIRQNKQRFGVLTLMDAQLGELYWAYYESSTDKPNMQEQYPPQIAKFTEINITTKYPIIILGCGLSKNLLPSYEIDLQVIFQDTDTRLDARYIISAWEKQDNPELCLGSAHKLEPMYIRNTAHSRF